MVIKGESGSLSFWIKDLKGNPSVGWRRTRDHEKWASEMHFLTRWRVNQDDYRTKKRSKKISRDRSEETDCAYPYERPALVP